MRLATIFSGGLAAPEWALKYLGIEHETVFAAEIDKFARQMYLANHGEPTSQFYHDVYQIDGNKYKGQIDMFIGGSPCQAFSIAGNRGGFEDTRGTLFFQFVRLVKEIQPRYFIFENVKGLLNHDKGNTWKTILNAFEDIGYLFAYKVMNAKKHGTPQNRERVFVVGFREEDDYHRFSFPQEIPLTLTLGDVLDSEVEEKYYLSQKMISYLENKDRAVQPYNGTQTVAPTMTATYSKTPTDGFYINVVGMLDMKGNDQIRLVYGQDDCAPCLSTMQGGMREPKIKVRSATKAGYEIASLGDSINLSVPQSKTRRGRVGKGVAQTLDCSCNQGVIEPKIKAYLTPFREEKRQNGRRECEHGEPMFTLTAQDIHGVSIEDKKGYRIRKLTPRECFRLMGDYEDRVKIVVSDTQAYKCASNGIEIRTMMSLIKSIIEKQSTNSLFDFQEVAC